MKSIAKYAWINALGTAAYIALIVSSIYFVGNSGLVTDKTVLGPIVMLMLFVFSAAFTGILVLGRPILWYLNGKKKEAVTLLVYTLAIFLFVILIVFAVLVYIA